MTRLTLNGDYSHGVSSEFIYPESCLELKKYKYAMESYFQESFTELLNLKLNITSLSKTSSYILLKPDFFAFGDVDKLRVCLDKLNISVIGVYPVKFNRHKIRELWRYEFNCSTYDRYELIDKILMSGDGVCLLLQGLNKLKFESVSDASTRLMIAKKESCSELNNMSIREFLNVGEGTLNFIHTPDEFIDFIREIGVLFDKKEREDIYSDLKRSASVEFVDRLRKVESTYEKSSLDIDSYSVKKKSSEWYDVLLLNKKAKFKNSDIPRLFDFEGIQHEST